MLRKPEGRISLNILSYNDLHRQLYYIGRKMHNFEYGKKLEWFVHKYSNGAPAYIQIFLNMQKLIGSIVASNSSLPYIANINSCIDEILKSLSRDVSCNKRISATSVANFLYSLTSFKNILKENKEKPKYNPILWTNIVLNFITLYGNNL